MRANICRTQKHLLSEIKRTDNSMLWYSGDEFTSEIHGKIKPGMFYLIRDGVIRHVVDSKIFESLDNAIVIYEFDVANMRKDDWGKYMSKIYDYHIQRHSDLKTSQVAITYNPSMESLIVNKDFFPEGTEGYTLVIKGKPIFDVSY